MTTPDPITTAREALDKLNKHVKPELNSPNCDRFNQIYAAFDYAEKLKAERDELEKSVSAHWTEIEHLNAATDSEVTRLTSQLEQAERVLAPFADAAKAFAPVISDSDWCPIDFVCGKDMAEITVQVLSFRAASQWIKDRQAKGGGIVSMDTPSPVQPDHIAEVGNMIDPLSIGDK